MANREHLAILRRGVKAWNAWRCGHRDARINLAGANLRGAKLAGADLIEAVLRRADLTGADLRGAILVGASISEALLVTADLTGANLAQAGLRRANLTGASLVDAQPNEAFLGGADLSKANLRSANLHRAALDRAVLEATDFTQADLRTTSLREANFNGAVLRGADLQHAALVGTSLRGCDPTGCRVYGMAAWDLKLDGAVQESLIITPRHQPEITVDNLEVAQFLYLLLNNGRIRHVIGTITAKAVLILGRFTPERKTVLKALRDEMRRRDYLPILFDFDKPAGKDLTGTVQTLANMARFVIADLTDPSSVPHELAMVVPGTVVPVQPGLLDGQAEYAMFGDLRRRYGWVLEPYCYASPERMIADLGERVIARAEEKARELRAVPPAAR